MFDKYTLNLINPATGKRPLAQFGSFGEKANTGNDDFNALQAQIHRRFKNGLMLQSNYMWSHGITDASIGAGESVTFQNMSCRACDRSSTNIDVRHYFTTNAIYELPFGKGKPFAQSGLGASCSAVGNSPASRPRAPACPSTSPSLARLPRCPMATPPASVPIMSLARISTPPTRQPRTGLTRRHLPRRLLAPGATLGATPPTVPARWNSTRRCSANSD